MDSWYISTSTCLLPQGRVTRWTLTTEALKMTAKVHAARGLGHRVISSYFLEYQLPVMMLSMPSMLMSVPVCLSGAVSWSSIAYRICPRFELHDILSPVTLYWFHLGIQCPRLSDRAAGSHNAIRSEIPLSALHWLQRVNSHHNPAGAFNSFFRHLKYALKPVNSRKMKWIKQRPKNIPISRCEGLVGWNRRECECVADTVWGRCLRRLWLLDVRKLLVVLCCGGRPAKHCRL